MVYAHYEYDPFGSLTKLTENATTRPEYRFSTKPRDITTGLYYYAYRWYDALTGRWKSKDPIEEEGGVNLYGFVRNAATGRLDILGREEADPPKRNEKKEESEKIDQKKERSGKCEKAEDEGNVRYFFITLPKKSHASGLSPAIKYIPGKMAERTLEYIVTNAPMVKATVGLAENMATASTSWAVKVDIVGMCQCCKCSPDPKWTSPKFHGEEVNEGAMYSLPDHAAELRQYIESTFIIVIDDVKKECKGEMAKDGQTKHLP